MLIAAPPCRYRAVHPAPCLFSRRDPTFRTRFGLGGSPDSLQAPRTVGCWQYTALLQQNLLAATPVSPALTLLRSLSLAAMRTVSQALDEINAGICDGMTYEDIAQRYPEEYAARKKDKLRYR